MSVVNNLQYMKTHISLNQAKLHTGRVPSWPSTKSLIRIKSVKMATTGVAYCFYKNFKTNLSAEPLLELCPPYPERGGIYCLLVRFPLASASASALASIFSWPRIIFWTSRWNITKLAYIHCLEEENSLLDFSGLDLVFKVTAAPWNVQNTVSNSHRYIVGKRRGWVD